MSENAQSAMMLVMPKEEPRCLVPAQTLAALEAEHKRVSDLLGEKERWAVLRATIALNIERGVLADGKPLPDGACEVLLALCAEGGTDA